MKAIFLDRDGVINEDYGYVSSRADFRFCAGACEALRELAARGFALFVVTNQSGIGRGLYGEADFADVSAFMLAELARAGVSIARIFHCSHAPEARCECRKPRPAMILRARDEFGVDLAQSAMVGDKITDVLAGLNAGVGRNFLLGSAAGGAGGAGGADFGGGASFGAGAKVAGTAGGAAGAGANGANSNLDGCGELFGEIIRGTDGRLRSVGGRRFATLYELVVSGTLF